MSPGGLGLYVSHQIMKAHGGTIWAQSEGVGKGEEASERSFRKGGARRREPGSHKFSAENYM